MARRPDHNRDVLQHDLYHQRGEQGEATSADTPDGERAHRDRREGFAPSHILTELDGSSELRGFVPTAY